MTKQPNQFTYRDTILRSREQADAQKAVIEAEIRALEAEIGKRRFAIEEIDKLLAAMEPADKKAGAARPPLLPVSKAAPVRPALKHGAERVGTKRKPVKKRTTSKKKSSKSEEGQGEQE